MRYEARAPLRIDFGGGWTDVPLYAEREGGAVLNAAITRYARGHISRPESEGFIRALRGDRSYVQYSLDLPSGAGLGASAAQTVLWVTLVKTTIANISDREEIADIACRIGGLLGIFGGKQDEYASALGGLTYFTFGESVTPHRLNPPPSLLRRLQSRLVLVYTGKQRLSSAIHDHVWTRYAEGDRAVTDALASLKRLAGDMRDCLLNGDVDQFGLLLNDNWACQKALHSSIHNPDVDQVIDLALVNGAIGGKACGAGGGGCLLFLAREGQEPRLRAALRRSKLQLIDFDFDTYGVYLSKDK